MPRDKDRNKADNQDDKNVSTATATIDNPDQPTEEAKDVPPSNEEIAVTELLWLIDNLSLGGDRREHFVKFIHAFFDMFPPPADKLSPNAAAMLAPEPPLLQPTGPAPAEYYLPPPDQAKKITPAPDQPNVTDEKKPVQHGEPAWS